MRNPKTVHEVFEALQQYHQQRATTYKDLAAEATGAMAKMLLEHLVELEDQSKAVVSAELEKLSKRHTNYMTSGPAISRQVNHVADDESDQPPSFQEVLVAALTVNPKHDELLDRLDSGGAPAPVQELAKRLREFEQTKQRQTVKFTRMD